MKRLILLPLLLGLISPAIAHNEFNGGDGGALRVYNNAETGEGEGAETGDLEECPPTCGGGVPRPVSPISN